MSKQRVSAFNGSDGEVYIGPTHRETAVILANCERVIDKEGSKIPLIVSVVMFIPRRSHSRPLLLRMSDVE